MEDHLLNVASLNFSGINLNPFEYDDGSSMFELLNPICKNYIRQHFGHDFNSWSCVKVDKELKTHRLSPCTETNNFLDQNMRLLNSKQFHQKWRIMFSQSPHFESISAKFPQDQIQNLINMDLIFYKTISVYLFRFEESQFDQKIKSFEAALFINFLKKQHDRPFCKLEVKQQLVWKYIRQNHIDLMFLQEVEGEWKSEIENYEVYEHGNDSMIIFQKNLFGEIDKILSQKYQQELNFNNDSVCLATTQGYLLISAHLKSTKEHVNQAKQMFLSLKSKRNHNQDLKIIVGIDSNHFLADTQNSHLEHAPFLEGKSTTVKKRSFLQAQFKKAEIAVSEVKDHIISSQEIYKHYIEKVNGKAADNHSLPTDQHPYDHYIVKAKIFCPDSTKSSILKKAPIQKETVQIIEIATLNFSGINVNPFEYQDGSGSLTKMNQICEKLIKKEFGNELSGLANQAKLDKHYQTNRISIAFTEDFEVGNQLANQQQFNELWMSRYSQEKQSLFEKAQINFSNEEVAKCAKIDYIFYQVALIYLYSMDQNDLNFQLNIKQLDPQTLRKFLHKRLNRMSSNLEVKQQLILNYFQKEALDILCLQEASSVDWQKCFGKQFEVIHEHDSVVIYNREKLGNAIKNHQAAKSLDFNEDSSVVFTDKNYLIISSHLRSSNVHLEQGKSMFETLHSIMQKYPSLKILIGIDSNHYMGKPNSQKDISEDGLMIVPSSPDKPTSVKARTYLQFQFHKANVKVSEVKDHLLSTGRIQKYSIQLINGSESKEESLPNKIHPYDHFLVHGKVIFG